MNVWTGLLFLEGSVADAGLARELAAADPVAPATRSTAATVAADLHDAREVLGTDRLFSAGGLH